MHARGFAVIVAGALVCGASDLHARQAPAAPASAPAQATAPAEPDPFLFTSEAAQVIFQVKPSSTADFEGGWREIKAKLSASDKPDWKAMGDSISLWRVGLAGASADAPAIYVLELNPASKTLSYHPEKILLSAGTLWDPKDGEPLYRKIRDSLAAGFNVLPLTRIK